MTERTVDRQLAPEDVDPVQQAPQAGARARGSAARPVVSDLDEELRFGPLQPHRERAWPRHA